MAKSLILLPVLLVAAPAFAAPAPSPSQLQVPPQLTDPRALDRVTDAMQAMSQAIMDLPVGNIEAALEGRPATPADGNRRIRDIEPGLDREVKTQVAQARPMIRRSAKALSDALPEMMHGIEQVQKSLERAAANMPDPNYPKR
jgi:hypothetical protein